MQCPACQHENKPAARFCEACGERLARQCPSCSEEVGPQARFCSACGAAIESTAPPHAAHRLPGEDASLPAGERRQLTVLFCDLVGSTEIASRMDPEEWSDIAARYQRGGARAVAGGVAVEKHRRISTARAHAPRPRAEAFIHDQAMLEVALGVVPATEARSE